MLDPTSRYHLALDGKVSGPHGLAALREMASIQAFTRDALVTPEHTENWQPIHALPELAAALFPATAKLQLKAKAVTLLRKLGGRAADGQLLTTSTPTVGRYLEDWFATNTDAWRPSTRRGYRGAIDLYLKPTFGALRLEQLSPAAVQRWLTQHKDEHGARRRITIAHAVLRSAPLGCAAVAAGDD